MRRLGVGDDGGPPPAPWLRSTLYMRIAQFFAGLALLLGAWLATTEYAFLIGGAVVILILMLVGVLAEWKRRRKALQAIATMQREGFWLYWQLSPAIWAQHCRRHHRHPVPMLLILGAVAALIIGLVTLADPWFRHGWAPAPNGGDLRLTSPDGRAFAQAVMGLFLGLGLVIDLVHAVVRGIVRRRGMVAIIGPQGAVVGGEFMSFAGNVLQRFQGATIQGAPDPVLALHFSETNLRYSSAAGTFLTDRAVKVLSLPIPEGWHEDAERVLAALGPPQQG